MSIFKSKVKLNIIMVVVLAMLMQIVMPMVGVVFAEGDVRIPDDEIEMEFKKLLVKEGGHSKTITNSDDAKDIELKEGQEVEVFYSFNMDLKQPYEIGSYFTFQLPQSVIAFDEDKLSGIVNKEGEPTFNYSTDSDGLVTVTFSDALSPSEYTVNLSFGALFGNFGDEEDLDQDLEIPLTGGDEITIGLTFLPSTSDEEMKKTGTVESKDGKKYINWTLWVNEAGEELTSATLDDTLGEGHELVQGSIKVKKYKVGLNGPSTTETENDIDTSIGFPLDLEDGKFEYEITYQTEVTRIASLETETFKNTATLNNDSKDKTATGEVKITYGTPLAKSQKGGDKYRAHWEINYNYLGAAINEGEAEITDVLSGAHKIDPGTLKVYEVTIGEDGKEVDGKAVELTKDTHYTAIFSDDDKKLVINFSNSADEGTVTKAFKVTYDTVSTEEYITKGSTVTNTVTSTNKNSENKEYTANGSLHLGEGIFGKSRGAIDYDNKIITWKLTIKAEKDLNDFVVEDTFTTIDGKSNQTLVKNVGEAGVKEYFTITGYDVAKVELTELSDTEGYKLSFGNIPKDTNITITYKTKFDIKDDGSAYTKYGNSATATWKGLTNQEYSITKKASYEPKETPTGKNGYKNGSFNYATQKFTWNVAVNINKQNIKGATLTDTLGTGHYIAKEGANLKEFISVKKLILGSDDTGTAGTALPPERWGIIPIEEGGFITGYTIAFNDDLTENENNQAYIISYESMDIDDIIGQEDGSGVYTNSAVFKTTIDYPLNGKVTINNPNELIGKSGKQNADDTITWTVDVNKSHSNLGNTTLTDTPSSNQMLLKDTIRIRKSIKAANGNITYGTWKLVDSDNIEFTDGGFILELGDLTNKGYQVEYKTFFTGGASNTLTNTASISWKGVSSGEDNSDGGTSVEYKDNSSSGDISSKKGTIRLYKIGRSLVTEEEVKLPGVTFALYNKTGVYKLYEAETDVDGILTFEDIRYGSYIIKELEAPNGYIKIPETGIKFKMEDDTNTLIDNGEDKTLRVINTEIYQAVRITKLDSQGNGLSGAKFVLYNSDGEQIIKDKDGNDLEPIIIGEDGTAVVNNLPVGNYYFTEITPPDYYILPTGQAGNTKEFGITADQTELKEVTMENTRGVGKIILTKVDSVNPNILLEGVKFSITNSDGTINRTENTDGNGKIEFADLPYDTYTITEIEAHSDYVLNNATRTIILDSDTDDHIEELEIDNTKKDRSIRLTKYNASKRMTLNGAIFELRKFTDKFDEKQDPIYEIVLGMEDLTTDNNGEIFLNDLLVGNYQLIETKAPSGYRINREPIYFEITVDQNETKELEMINTRVPDSPDPEGRIKIIKKDYDTKELLSGAKFDIIDSNDKVVDTLTTNNRGVATSKYLPTGRYTIKETKAPQGYIMDVEVIEERVTNGSITEVVVYNDKEDPEDPDKPTDPTDPTEPEKPTDPTKPGDDDEFEDVDDMTPEDTTKGDKPTLPKTGSVSPIAYLLLGLVTIALGLLLRREKVK